MAELKKTIYLLFVICYLFNIALVSHGQVVSDRAKRQTILEVSQPGSSNETVAPILYYSHNASTASEQNKSIDWFKVEHTFNKYLSDDEILQKWELMEANMKSGIRSLLRTVFPKVVSMSSDAKVSSNCSAGILKWIVNLRHMKSWALKMLDATGKPPSGIFEGVVTMFGNYEECLKIRVMHDDDDDMDEEFYNKSEDDGGGEETKEFFRGQYCVAEFKPWLPKKPRFYGMNTMIKPPRDDDSVFSEFAKMSAFFHFIAFRMDLCVPSTCTKEDMQRVATLMANLAEFRARVLRCEIDSDDTKWTAVSIWTSWVISILIVMLILITIIATLKDLKMCRLQDLDIKFLRLFSLQHSWKVLRDTRRSRNSNLNSLYSIRMLILLWIIIVHTFIVVDFQYFREMQTLKSWASKWPTQIITNSLFQFDCLILITAFTFGYYNIENTSIQLLKYLLTRYVKLAVLMLFMIVITLLTPFFLIRGPLTQDFLPKQTQSCQTNGWINMLFLQNYFNTDCLSNTWLLCVEFQMMLLMTPLLSFYHRFVNFKWLFWAAMPFLLVTGLLYSFFTVYTYKLPPTYYWTLPDKEQRNEYFITYYYKPWAHLSVFTIGFYAGAYRKLSNDGSKTVLSDQGVTYFGYILSIFTIVTFTFGFHDWIVSELPNEFISAIYNSCQNLGLAMAYSWILFSITDISLKDSKSIIYRAINTRMIVFLGRLTLCGYLSLPLVQTLLLSTQQQHLYSGTLLMLYVIIGNIILTYLLSFCLTLLVEIPCSLALMPVVKKICPIQHAKAVDNGNPEGMKNTTTQSPPSEIELPMYKEKL